MIIIYSCTYEQGEPKEVNIISEYPEISEDTLLEAQYVFTSIAPAEVDTADARSGALSFYHGNNDSLYYLFYNLKRKTFDVFNLDAAKRSSRVFYNFEFATNGSLFSMYVHNLDSIFFLQDYRIALGNQDSIYESWEINSRSMDTLPEFWRTDITKGLFPMFYEKGKVYVSQYCAICEPNDPNHFKQAVEIALNLETGEFQDFGAPSYPKRYLENDYGFMTNPSRAVNNNLHVYSFPADPFLYVKDLNTGELKQYPARSRYQEEEIASYIKDSSWTNDEESQKKLEHLSTAGGYHEVIYDPHRNLYYRTFNIPQPLEREDGKFTTYDDYKVVLMIFDENFKLKKEIILHRWFEASLNPSPKGLIRQTYSENKEEMLFRILKIED